MRKPMIGNISKYYQNIISRINAPEMDYSVFTKHALNKDLITGFGTIIYNVNQRGFYGIIDEDGNKILIECTDVQPPTPAPQVETEDDPDAV